MLTINKIKSAVAKVGKKYGVKRAYLFGSYARGDASASSDVDILIEKGKIRNLIDLSGFRLELVDELGTEVDVMTTSSVNSGFYNIINKDKTLVYES